VVWLDDKDSATNLSRAGLRGVTGIYVVTEYEFHHYKQQGRPAIGGEGEGVNFSHFLARSNR
jgi:hypothetical protein